MNWTSNMNKSYTGQNYLRFPVLGLIALFQRRGPAKSQVRVYLEKRTILPGFRNITSAEYVHRKTTQLALKKRWTNETVSIAAIFSRCCSRVEKTQAFEDGLTEGEVPETGVGRFRSLSQTDRTKS